MLRPLRRPMPRQIGSLLAILTLSLALPAGAAPQLGITASHRVAEASAVRPASWTSALVWNFVCLLGTGGLCRAKATPLGEIGCLPDPNGLCSPPAATQGDIGCLADPGGHCNPN